MGAIYVVILIFVCTLLTQGFNSALSFIGRLITLFIEFVKCIGHLVIKFPDLFGVTDWLWTRGIYLVIAIAAAFLSGYAFTRKQKRKILGIVSSIVSLISAIRTFL